MTVFNRLREQGSQTPSSFSYEFYYYGPPPVSPPGSGSLSVGCYAGTYKSIRDVKTPKFRKTVDPSKWVANPLIIETVYAQASNGSVTSSNTADQWGHGITRTWSGDGVGYILGALVPAPRSTNFSEFPDLVNVDRLRELTIIRCLNRINPAKALTWVSVAEGRETVDTILDRARKLANTWKACKSGDISRLNKMFPNKRTTRYPKRIVLWDEHGQPVVRKNGKPVARYGHKPWSGKDPSQDSASNLWLEYRYGWSPLVYDIIDELKAIYAQSLRDDLQKFAVTRVFEKTNGESTENPIRTSPSFGGGRWTYETAYTHKVSVRAYAKYQVEHEAGVMNRLNDFGAFDVPRAVWEVVPFSFVVDWFVPIGDWLQALTPKVGVNVKDSGVTTVTSKEVTRTLRGYTPDGTGAGYWPSPPFPIGSSDGFLVGRKERSIGLPVPLFPPPEVKLNLKRLGDAVSLLRGARHPHDSSL